MKDFQFEIVSKRIAELLKTQAPNKTHEEISQMAGIAPSVISKLKRCEGKTPSCETIFKFASAFNVSADWLLGLSDYKTTNKTTKSVRALCEELELTYDMAVFMMNYPHDELSCFLRNMIEYASGKSDKTDKIPELLSQFTEIINHK